MTQTQFPFSKNSHPNNGANFFMLSIILISVLAFTSLYHTKNDDDER